MGNIFTTFLLSVEGDMKFTLCCLFLFVAFACAQVNRDCDIISGPYKCNDDIDVRLNLAAETMEVEYPDGACTYSARAFMHDEDLVVPMLNVSTLPTAPMLVST